MGLAWSDDVAETKSATAKAEHKAIGADERLTGELTRSISRDRKQRSVIFLHLQFTQVAVNSAARSVKDTPHSRPSHRLDNIIRERRALVKIDLRFRRGSRDIGIGSEMDHDIMACHYSGQALHIAHVAAHYAQAIITRMMLVMPFPSRRKIVVESKCSHSRVSKQAVGEMAADEPGAADDYVTAAEVSTLRPGRHPNAPHANRLRQIRLSVHQALCSGRIVLSPILGR